MYEVVKLIYYILTNRYLSINLYFFSKKTRRKYCMNEKSAYLCIRFREGKWLSDDMMNESGSESRIGQVSYLAMAQGSEKSFPETFLKIFSKKISKKFAQ